MIPRKQIRLSRPVMRTIWKVVSLPVHIVDVRQPLTKDFYDLDVQAIARSETREIVRLMSKVTNLTEDEIHLLPTVDFVAIQNVMVELSQPSKSEVKRG